MKIDVWVPHELTQKKLMNRIGWLLVMKSRSLTTTSSEIVNSGEPAQTVAITGLTVKKVLAMKVGLAENPKLQEPNSI